MFLCTDVCGQEEGSCGPDLCWCPCRRGKVTEFIYIESYCLVSFILLKFSIVVFAQVNMLTDLAGTDTDNMQ